MVTVDFQHILTTARQLPRPSQAKLVSALLQEHGQASPQALEPLIGLSEAELHALADSVLAPEHARRLKHLLRLQRENTLPPLWQAELDVLLEESDRIALVKAKASYTLKLLQA